MDKSPRLWDADFLLAMNKEKLSNPYIIQVPTPHYAGKVLFFDSELAAASWIATYNGMGYRRVGHYRIFIVFSGMLMGHQLLAHEGFDKELEALLTQMANFYERHTIEKNLPFYQKYLT